VAETEEKAIQNAKQFMWMQGEFTGLAHPVWSSPSGYFSPSQRRGFVEFATGRAVSPRGNPTFEDQLDSMMIIAGTPDQVIAKLKYIMEETRPGIMALWGNDGSVSPEDARTCIRLLGQEVMPALKAYGRELGLTDPFEIDAPVHLRYSKDLKQPAVAAE
jgi:alkanesulfonate monooxygenase SsuD/methylene tetrahydromethanopterin reductase-like flavin-dependent oxidoreductase (luciferase family)